MGLERTSWPAREGGTSVRAGVFYVDRTMRQAQEPKLQDRLKKHAGGGHGRAARWETCVLHAAPLNFLSSLASHHTS